MASLLLPGGHNVLPLGRAEMDSGSKPGTICANAKP